MPQKPLATSPPIAMQPVQGAWDRALFCGLLLWTFLTLCFPLLDTDFWWHLKTGELILSKGSVPLVDWYTYTDYDKPWIDLHWGFQILIALLYGLGGVKLVTLAKATVITSAVALGWAAAGRGLPAWLKVLLWVPAVICISGRGNERPEMLSQLFLAFWLWTATTVERRPALIWALPAVHLVWVNCHALFVLGLVVGAAYVADCVARDFAGGRWGLAPPARAPSARAIIWSGALVAAACFANPYFDEGAWFPLVLYRKFSVDQPFYSKLVGEFQPPLEFVKTFGWKALGNIYLVSEAGLWCIAAASFVWLLRARRRWSLMRVLLFAAFSHLAWKASRNTNVFAIVAAFVACENVGEVLAGAPAAANENKLLRRTWGVAVVLAGLIAAVVTGAWNDIGERDKPFGLGERENWFIHAPAKFAGQPGFPALAFVGNNGQAAVYEYHNGPARRVFMDGRLEVSTREHFKIYNDIGMLMMDVCYQEASRAVPEESSARELTPAKAPESARRWPEILRQMSGGDLPTVILDCPTSILLIMGVLGTPGWRPVFADSTGVVFLSDEQADNLSLPRAELPRDLEMKMREIEARLRRVRPASDFPGP